MVYIVSSTERTKKSGSDMETKALLHLMNFHINKNEIHYFIVDFFNDLTGMNRSSTKLWDLQSKSGKNTSPKAIGRELVTLYKNFLSHFNSSFYDYILFSGGVSKTVRINNDIDCFGIENITDNAKDRIINGLIDECNKKKYIDNRFITKQSINLFLEKVVFVIDNKTTGEYVKEIIKDHPNIIPDESGLNSIFNEIRNAQSSKKNDSVIENKRIETSDEALNYYRHLTSNEIRLLTLQRIINRNPIESGIPLSFITIYNDCPEHRRQDMIDECQAALCRALFNKNSARGFWSLFNEIYNLIISFPKSNTQDLFNKLDKDLIDGCPDFGADSVKYFISVIKDGIQK